MTLSDETEILTSIVSLLVRLKNCECGNNSIVALEDVVVLLNKLKRYAHTIYLHF